MPGSGIPGILGQLSQGCNHRFTATLVNDFLVGFEETLKLGAGIVTRGSAIWAMTAFADCSIHS
jgi:hypothetical protein